MFKVIYGDTALRLDARHIKIPKINANPKYRMPFCHQSAFVRTDLLKKYKFNTSFKVAADNDLFTRLYNDGYSFYYFNHIVSIYDANGISSKPSWQFFKEELAIIARQNVLFAFIFIPKYLLKSLIRLLLPKSIVLKLNLAYNAKDTKNIEQI